MKWVMEWNGSQLMKWSEVWEIVCNSWYVLFNCRKTSNFKFWNGNEVEEVWNEVKYEWMNEMEYGWMSKWNEMKWDGP